MTLTNGQPVPAAQVPRLDFESFASRLGDARTVALSSPDGEHLLAVLEREGHLEAVMTRPERRYPSLTPACPQLHLFERELAERWGFEPVGHPWLKPVRRPQRAFFRVHGPGVHEVAVGPVHAGVIEPGHFRFQGHGEEVLHLEIALGYQHRGIVEALTGGPHRRTLVQMETVAGDTTIGHALAYCELLEGFAGCAAPPRAEAVRALALELERLANHCGDLGALAADVGYLPTAAYCGRLRGDFLNLTAELAGNRLGRGLLVPGGVLQDRVAGLGPRVERALEGSRQAVELMWRSSSARARMEGVGSLPAETARDIGLVGPAARACGLEGDVRCDFPSGAYRRLEVPRCTGSEGDIFARARQRWNEMEASAHLVLRLLEELPEGPLAAPLGPLAPKALCVSLVEGWRGEICHLALTDHEGRFSSYTIVDPSFHNWFGLALAMRGQAISDFPLCNKSFNLSYCGHDL